jgi:hypothetical protein
MQLLLLQSGDVTVVAYLPPIPDQTLAQLLLLQVAMRQQLMFKFH